MEFGVSSGEGVATIASHASGSGVALPIAIKTGVNATERMRITPAGRVVIGSSSPFKTEILHVSSALLGSVATNEVINSCAFMPDGSDTGLITKTVRFTNGSTHYTSRNIIQRVVNYTNMGYIGFDSNSAVSLGYGSSQYFNIDTSGNVGIGTNTPAYKLQVYGGTAAVGGGGIDGRWQGINNNNVQVMDFGIGTLSGYPDSIGLSNATSTGPLDFGTNNQIRMRINSNGKIGVNTNNPNGKVEIYNPNGFVPSNSTVANAALVVAGEYGGGITLVDGTHYSSLYNIGGRFSIGSGTASGVMERLTIDSTGNVGIGDPNPSGWNSKLMVKVASGYVQSTVLSQGNASSDIASLTVGANGSTYAVTTQAYGDGFVQVQLNGAAGKERRTILTTSNSPRWSYGVSNIAESGSNAGSDFYIVRYSDTGAYLGTPITIYRSSGEVYFDGPVLPAGDNSKTLGNGSARWSVVYAGTGTINTSDAREKNEVRSLTEAEISAAQALSKELGAYKFLSSIAEKGDAAREHIGMTVQRAIEIMESFGLVPFNYGFICYDEWDTETQTIPAVEASDAVIGENGDVVVPAVEAKPEEIKVIREAGNRYSFRMDELSMFISRGLVAKLESIEARLAALEV